MKLYDYFRSSAAYRVRIALNFKGLSYEQIAVHLTRDGGEQKLPVYRAVNPQGLVPSFEIDGTVLNQSLAIIEYLDEIQPDPPLLPGQAAKRARVRAMALLIACDIHPINNLRVLQYLRNELGQNDAAVDAWYRHWVEEGLNALEALVSVGPHEGDFCVGGSVTLADVCLVPQMYNARRFDCDLSGCPTLVKTDEVCRALPAFARAAPDRQPDAA